MTDFTFFVSLKLHMRFTTLLTKDIGIFLKKIKSTFFFNKSNKGLPRGLIYLHKLSKNLRNPLWTGRV